LYNSRCYAQTFKPLLKLYHSAAMLQIFRSHSLYKSVTVQNFCFTEAAQH